MHKIDVKATGSPVAFEIRKSYGSIGVIGLEPVLKISQFLQLRGLLEGYMPYRAVKCGENGEAILGRPWHDPEFYGELRFVAQMKFASVSAYTHYSTAPEGHWNFGLTLGLYIPAPSFFH